MSEIIEDGMVVGAKTGARITKRWEPKEWRTEYEAMVALSCTGLSNEEVGKRFGYGKQQVSNILNTAMGKKLKVIILDRLRKSNEETFAERISHLQNRALANIENVLNNEDYLERQPLAIFDRSQKFLTSTTAKGFKSEQPESPQRSGDTTNIVIVQGATRDSLAEAMAKADQAKELASGLVRTTVAPISRAGEEKLAVGRTEVRALKP